MFIKRTYEELVEITPYTLQRKALLGTGLYSRIHHILALLWAIFVGKITVLISAILNMV